MSFAITVLMVLGRGSAEGGEKDWNRGETASRRPVAVQTICGPPATRSRSGRLLPAVTRTAHPKLTGSREASRVRPLRVRALRRRTHGDETLTVLAGDLARTDDSLDFRDSRARLPRIARSPEETR